ncbi:MAG: metallophosphoesterase, partial [Nanoarchaeota archaeon]|nr:metallophosphoesterase [Nanoarchaeota archaeon]
MEKAELQKICLEKNVLLDSSFAKIFSSLEEISLVLFLIEKIKLLTGKKFFNESLLKQNASKIKKFVKEFSEIKRIDSSLVLKKMGLGNFKDEISSKKEDLSSGRVKIVSSFNTEGKKFEVKDFVTHFRNRYEEIKLFLQEKKELENLVSINKLSQDRQKFSVIGMVYDKRITKTKRVLLEIEDLTGKMRVLINPDSEEIAKKCEDIPLDSVLGFRGTGSSEILFANEIIFPEAGLEERKKSPVEEYAAFIGDVHFGSKKFLEKDFKKMVDYLNGEVPNTPEALKIKYLFIVGDLITGVGNYPDQERDLNFLDLEAQFEKIADILGDLRKDIKIIISPGNHDGVRLMEPQPLLNEKYAWPLYEL